MTTIAEIYKYIDIFAPFESAEEWDNVGVLVGDINKNVTRVLLALDITNEVLDEAMRLSAQLVISHHPIIFQPIKRLPAESPVYKAASHGITCLCAHTNLDKSREHGVNTALAAAAGLLNFRQSDEGHILFLGDTDKTITAAEFALRLKIGLSAGGLVYTNSCNEIHRVGLCSGGGGSEIYAAAKAGCDAFITGEIKHHELMFANESKISTFVLGHFTSENVVLEPLKVLLKDEFPEVEFFKSAVLNDQTKYM
ncbi:MAG: Nif3-like dinuclear metal center hexameric protein [Clostridia bacterium]|nr:Nif3-like dinuclear metal center hexameric protein [Clostridia bacterium]